MKISSLFAVFAAVLAVAPFGCAEDPELTSRTLKPPITGVFDAGNGGENGASGTTGATTGTGMTGSGSSSSGGQGGMGGGGPSCADAQKRCAHDFTYPAGAETTVELRGSFAPGAWDTGVPLTKTGALWSVTVDIPYDVEVLYKLVVDGVWITDPNNPYQADDGFGGFNSLLTGIECIDWTCAP